MTSITYGFTELLVWLWVEQRQAALLLLLGLAAVIDWRSFRIPNWLSLGGALAALLYSALVSLAVAGPGGLGFGTALGGWALGLALFLPFYALGVMGAGDVKLMAMVGAFLGYPSVAFAVLFVLVTGGVVALAFMAMHQRWTPLLHNLRLMVLMPGAWRSDAGFAPAVSVGKVPYGVSIALGTAAFMVSRQVGWV